MDTLTQIRFLWKPAVFVLCLVPGLLLLGDSPLVLRNTGQEVLVDEVVAALIHLQADLEYLETRIAGPLASLIKHRGGGDQLEMTNSAGALIWERLN